MDRRGNVPSPSPCAEFPNDNPLLHRGAIWTCAEPCGRAVSERPLEASHGGASPAGAPGEPAAKGVEPVDGEPADAVTTDPAPPVLEADDPLAGPGVDGDDGIEVVDELTFDDAVDENLPAGAVADFADVGRAESAPPSGDDPFARLARVLEEVAAASGAGGDAVAMLRTLLGRARLDASAPADAKELRDQALAWQRILRGESEDFDACGGAMLDDWSAALVARVLGNASRADGLKRELRRRGVAAFGIVEQSA